MRNPLATIEPKRRTRGNRYTLKGAQRRCGSGFSRDQAAQAAAASQVAVASQAAMASSPLTAMNLKSADEPR